MTIDDLGLAGPGGATPVVPRTRPRRSARDLVLLILAVLVAIVFVSPLLLLAINSVKDPTDYATNGALSWPEHISFDSWLTYSDAVNYPRALLNSIISSGLVAVLGVAIAMLTAYALGIGRIKGNAFFTGMFLFATMIPQEALIYPLFYGADALGLTNTIAAVVIIFSVIQAAFGTYLLSSVLGTFPRELLEAAQIDGAGKFRIFLSVVVPIMRPTMSVLLVFFFIWTWNELLIPLVMLSDPTNQTVPIAIMTLKGQNATPIDQLIAGSMMSLIPTLLFFLIFQRTLAKGVTAGAVK
ncbi:carbohydrate ABC transporter permease [Brachybacterium huguangmaarense]|uniref:Carbohydrate ABC transporter permease n=1 Tax=Brachybacterium huguangmaarense TaxID=1652028 RepID=A0ABY6G1P8_9MICO|nr:carbohydrate ABC transporter permease [Brachybacterium huguangmaarense]UYG17120.1 carbohydrate ABC transporter permease [Brachybacterium huguangmaarense]